MTWKTLFNVLGGIVVIFAGTCISHPTTTYLTCELSSKSVSDSRIIFEREQVMGGDVKKVWYAEDDDIAWMDTNPDENGWYIIQMRGSTKYLAHTTGGSIRIDSSNKGTVEECGWDNVNTAFNLRDDDQISWKPVNNGWNDEKIIIAGSSGYGKGITFQEFNINGHIDYDQAIVPSFNPTFSPVWTRTNSPSWSPTWSATDKPTWSPTWEATEKPTWSPTWEATEKPTWSPTWEATEKPTWPPNVIAPTWSPVTNPTSTDSPVESPTEVAEREEAAAAEIAEDTQRIIFTLSVAFLTLSYVYFLWATIEPLSFV